MFLGVISRTDDKDSVKIDSDFHFDFLIAPIGQRLDLSDLELTNMRIHHRDITIVLSLHFEIISAIKCEDLGEGNLMKFGENDHVTSIRFGFPIQFDGIWLEKK